MMSWKIFICFAKSSSLPLPCLEVWNFFPLSLPFWRLPWLLSFPTLKSEPRFRLFLNLCFSSSLMASFLYVTPTYPELMGIIHEVGNNLFFSKWLMDCISTIDSIFHLKTIHFLKIKSRSCVISLSGSFLNVFALTDNSPIFNFFLSQSLCLKIGFTYFHWLQTTTLCLTLKPLTPKSFV